MKKSYLKGAIISLIFIFILFLSFNFLKEPMLSPGAGSVSNSANILLLLVPLIAGFLVVILVFFLIMQNFE